MILDRIMTTPCQIERAGATADRYGNTDIDWSNPTVTNTVCWFDANVSRFMHEDMRNADSRTSDNLVFLPAGTDISGTDRIVINGLRFEVFGVPAIYYRPGWGESHREARIKRYEG